MLSFTAASSAQQAVTITKCQNCSTNASKSLQACMATSGNAGAAGCQKAFQKRMAHCNKKWCSPKMTKVKVKPA